MPEEEWLESAKSMVSSCLGDREIAAEAEDTNGALVRSLNCIAMRKSESI
jgi:hypothetical protein